MCVALPGRVVAIDQDEKIARVDFSGNQVEARCGFVPISIGDSVLVHAGCILQKISQDEASQMEELFASLEELACEERV
ncbi:MAG: HypC/HybG/HupF family hydrogenase formation chaperone [Lachnospiraceae bacterium]|jgi:hydrogenase expression/formation protein HypC|nr:HypC/HybG/HupF family hydrogenase formation chaperone [Lachnospiraceae bacterium]MEE3357674.1 HypC/HybG/HupF family hydrogenase formation chaperone [Lachnospiraceae bacterium]